MGLRFIFMLTRNDQTVPDAALHLSTALELGVRHIGFKDIGLPVRDLRDLARAIRDKAATSYLEVVSLDRESEIASARAAVEIGVDVLLGGTRVEDVTGILAETGIAYFPFPGRIEGHPSNLVGSIEEIAASAARLAARDGVDGLDLLAYRSQTDVPALIEAVCKAAGKPVIVAGSIAGRDRIRHLRDAGAAGFTIGTAAIDGAYKGGGAGLNAQLSAILRDVAELNGHVSPFGKRQLDIAADSQLEGGALGEVNGMPIRVQRVDGAAGWRFHTGSDVMFLVHRGRLVMKFRDRDEMIEEGEFIVVPKGVEHCPVAVTDRCDLVVIGERPGRSE